MIKTTIRQFARSNLPLSIFIILPLLLLTFFSFKMIANADTTIDLTNYDFSFMSDLNTLTTQINNNSLGDNYLLFHYVNGSTSRYLVYLKQSGTFTTINNGYDVIDTSNSRLLCFSQGLQGLSPVFCDFNAPQYNYIKISDTLGGSNYLQLIYTPLDISWSSNISPVSSYIFTYGSSTFTYNPEADYLPTLSSLYEYFTFQPTPPPDDTPILTSFVDLSLEKIALICNFFTSSYVYLFVFVIFILYFVIYLVRRLSQ